MLELKSITKDYPAGDGIVHALRGISLKFRENEFVSVLGPSGCGKTTLLNIIGGLDQYTSGDLVINGKSTKDFKDRDWDDYRNKSIGFVFQSYNLIPHQTVLQNVELALTLSGVSKEERRARAKKALEDVGLGDQLNKRPNKMSGGQMQRVAIARALVNNPDIILADEPTGALDTETGVLVMEILKNISKDKLIIMVTHNGDLAEKYSSRIIRVLDGKLTGDSDAFDGAAAKTETFKTDKTAKKTKKASMSFPTAFSLSMRNLMTKKGRTFLTSFAGSVGIIGISLILALSQGFTAYIDDIQEQTLSSYPLTIQSSTMDLDSLLTTLTETGAKEITHDLDAVYSNPVAYEMMNSLSGIETVENDLKSFKAFLDRERGNGRLSEAVRGVRYSYDLDLLTYTKGADGAIIRSDPRELMSGLMKETLGFSVSEMMGAAGGGDMMSQMSSSPMSSMFSGGMSLTLWEELLPGKDGKPINDMLADQYDVVYGAWPNAYDQVVLVLDTNNELNDLTLYALGLETSEHMEAIVKSAINKTEVDVTQKKWSYADVCGLEFRVVPNGAVYNFDGGVGVFTDLSETDTGMNYLYDNGINLKITGIIRPKEDALTSMISGSIGYTSMLTDYVIAQTDDSAAVAAQLKDEATDIFSGLPFKTGDDELTNAEKQAAFVEYAKSLTAAEKAELYVKIMSAPTEEYVNSAIDGYLQGLNRADVEGMMTAQFGEQSGMSAEQVTAYIAQMDDETLFGYFRQGMAGQIEQQYADGVKAQMSAMPAEQLAAAFEAELNGYSEEVGAGYYDAYVPAAYSDATLDGNLKKLGKIDLDVPTSISLYASSFEAKDTITAAITDYNDSVGEVEQIAYTDYVGLMMSSMTSVINAITYVLIAFVAISLIVSSIMIGVITLISVQERTKEIGILRAIGASKHDVTSMFNAETIIIGFSAGLLGVGVSALLCFPINFVIHKVTGIAAINAFIPWQAGLALIAISVVLTLFSGLIPSRSAAKKDPVVALRTE